MGTVFPLFTNQMFRTLGYKWANSLFGLIALAMIPLPYVRHIRGFNFDCALLIRCISVRRCIFSVQPFAEGAGSPGWS